MINTDKEKVRRFGIGRVAENQAVPAPFYSDDGQEYFGAGQFVLSGCYVEVDGSRQVYLEAPGILPASLDGRRALYRKLERPWISLAKTSSARETRPNDY